MCVTVARLDIVRGKMGNVNQMRTFRFPRSAFTTETIIHFTTEMLFYK